TARGNLGSSCFFARRQGKARVAARTMSRRVLALMAASWSSALATELANASSCVSNSGRPYDEEDCNWYGKGRGCVWVGGECMCQGGGYYSKRQRTCWPGSSKSLPTPSPSLPPAPAQAPAFPVATELANASSCVSNSGRPYDEEDCNLYGKGRGCVWVGGECMCQGGGYYSKRQRTCRPASSSSSSFSKPSPSLAPSPAPAPELPVATELANASSCVSNSGRPYDEEDCDWYGKDRGCAWVDGECKCQGGGYYSKRQRTCRPAPSSSLSTPSPASSPAPAPPSLVQAPSPLRAVQFANASSCVSNHGKPYDEADCGWYGKDRGCAWNDGECKCQGDGGLLETAANVLAGTIAGATTTASTITTADAINVASTIASASAIAGERGPLHPPPQGLRVGIGDPRRWRHGDSSHQGALQQGP
ncbi:unnamed protein product, partial [Prorocentrum cordatum]